MISAVPSFIYSSAHEAMNWHRNAVTKPNPAPEKRNKIKYTQGEGKVRFATTDESQKAHLN